MKYKDIKFRAESYLKYLATAKSRHSVHSPFVFDFIHHVLEPDMIYYDFKELSLLRAALLKDGTELELDDFGAGSKISKSKKRSIGEITKQSVSPSFVSEMLYRLVHYYRLHNMLELGTNLGLTSLYLAKADSRNKLITLEGDPSLVKVAKRNFSYLEADNIKVRQDEFSRLLPDAMKELGKIDFAFIDGNHTEKATLEYFESLLPYTKSTSVLVFDDIHWSRGMENAWRIICEDPRVILTIDWYRLGFVFFNDGMEKQHFVLKQKP